MQRKENYQKISKALESLSQEEIQELLSSGEKIHIGIGGTAVKLEIESIPVFAKKIPLTEIDMQNEFSTKNLFNLPTYYQYGVGSTGFGSAGVGSATTGCSASHAAYCASAAATSSGVN